PLRLPPRFTLFPYTTLFRSRLARDHRRRRVADVHRIRVHDPRHGLLVGVDVWGRHVLLGTDEVDDFSDVAPGQRLELSARHLARIADHTALAAAERDMGHGAFPRHPRSERRDFIEGHAWMVADAAFGRS